MGRGYAKTQNWKKAVVTLKEGDTIDFFAEIAIGEGKKDHSFATPPTRNSALTCYIVSVFARQASEV